MADSFVFWLNEIEHFTVKTNCWRKLKFPSNILTLCYQDNQYFLFCFIFTAHHCVTLIHFFILKFISYKSADVLNTIFLLRRPVYTRSKHGSRKYFINRASDLLCRGRPPENFPLLMFCFLCQSHKLPLSRSR